MSGQADLGIIVFRPGQKPEHRTVPKPAGLDQIRRMVCPLLEDADLEHVAVLYNNAPHDMFVDEIGTLQGLPRNEEATAVYRASWLSRNPSDDPESLPAIHGPAVLTLSKVWF